MRDHERRPVRAEVGWRLTGGGAAVGEHTLWEINADIDFLDPSGALEDDAEEDAEHKAARP